jgi:hypothetical protein
VDNDRKVIKIIVYTAFHGALEENVLEDGIDFGVNQSAKRTLNYKNEERSSSLML